MGSRRHISRKDISASAFTPKPQPKMMESRGFGQGKKGRSTELPTTYDILQPRPFTTPVNKSSVSEVQPPTPESQEKAAAFGYNAGSISLFPPVAPIQAKLTIGEPGDKYEQEADAMAAQVVNQINTPQSQQTPVGETVQREEIEEDEVRKKPEVETIQREDMLDENEEEKISPKLESATLQRDEMQHEEEETVEPLLGIPNRNSGSVIQRAQLSEIDIKLPNDFELVNQAFDPGKSNYGDNALRDRVARTFNGLRVHIKNDWIDPSGYPELIKLVREVVLPLKKKHAVVTDQERGRVSENLSELEHAVNVINTQSLAAPLVLGAKGPETHGTGMVKHAEKPHGKLPPLGVDDLEVDSYYLTDDDVLHLDEVKNTPAAFAEKAKHGGQIGRQLEWLAKEVQKPDGENYKKRVGYAVQADQPKFDTVLSKNVIENLDLIDNYQTEVPFINIAGENFTVHQLRQMYEGAIIWLGQSKPVLDQKGIKFSDAASMYFGSLTLAKQTLAKGPLK